MNMAAGTSLNYEAVADLVCACAGLVFPHSRRADIKAGTQKIMAKAGIAGLPELLQRLRVDQLLLDDLIGELTVGETYFFREPSHFDFVRNGIIPEMQRLRGTEHALRAWSAGCASGEEAYSLAILFEESGLASRARILATDISPAALARAREALYGAWSLRGEGQRLIGRYVRRSGGRFQLAERFRQRVEFAYLNLAQDAYPSFATSTWGMDLVLCRNVLIYFDAKTIQAVARRLYQSLAAGGFLIAGPSDPMLADHAPFETLMTPAGLVYRRPVSRDAGIASSRAMVEALAVDDTPGRPAAVLGASMKAAILPPVAEHLPAAPTDPVSAAREALARGENARAFDSTRALTADASAMAICVRAVANLGDAELALATAADATSRHPISAELGFLHAVLLMNLGRYAEADRALRRVLYLDRSLAVAQFTLGATLHRLGNIDGAARAYRNARNLAVRRPADEIVPLSDGERAGRLADAAAAQVAFLGPQLEHVL